MSAPAGDAPGDDVDDIARTRARNMSGAGSIAERKPQPDQREGPGDEPAVGGLLTPQVWPTLSAGCRVVSLPGTLPRGERIGL